MDRISCNLNVDNVDHYPVSFVRVAILMAELLLFNDYKDETLNIRIGSYNLVITGQNFMKLKVQIDYLVCCGKLLLFN